MMGLSDEVDLGYSCLTCKADYSYMSVDNIMLAMVASMLTAGP
jgi:hypothetical protein